MFGWRARIGDLCPSVFEMIAYDFYRIVPPGVGLIGVTCMIDPRGRALCDPCQPCLIGSLAVINEIESDLRIPAVGQMSEIWMALKH